MAYTKPPRRPALINAFSKMRIKLASPDRILEWSRGEVTKPETINYRTQRSEKHGLFDEKIFGAEKDYECYCGKYKGIRYKGIVCDKCGVELTRAIVRRERMGHIELCSPVAHIWFLRGLPSRMATVLGMNAGDLEKVVYFAGYLITKVHEDEKKRLLADLESEYKLKAKASANDTERERLKDLALKARLEIDGIAVGRVLEEVEYHRFSVKYGGLFEAKIGAEAVFEILKKIDLDVLLSEMTTRYASAGAQEREKLEKRISLVRAMIRAGVRPEWMFLTRIPVIPPALRPMVALEGGRHASSDLNDLYRRVINRNNRLKKLLDIKAPEVILRNEKRILQEAVDALLDNSIRRSATPAGALNASQRRPLKSLADYLKGKQGYFRQNLLGKRVDYSGRSVIVVGPELEMDECGLPKHMALELFRPFVIAELMKRELAFNIRGAGRLIEDAIPEVWEILEEVTKGRYVLLNRAPTLHRQGIQAFRPVLIEGNAIQLHPMVCAAFNADFDGDQMAVHVPLSEEAQLEAREFIASSKNILKPGSGEVIVMSTKPLDIALGAYWLTKDVKGAKGEGKAFQSPNAAILAYDYGEVDIRAKIQVLPTPGKERYAAFAGERFETSVGRLLFNSVLPSDYPFVNYEITKKALSKLLEDFVERYGTDALPNVVDKVKKLGFSYATKAGVTWSMQDVVVPAKKREIVEGALSRVREIEGDYGNGFISSGEKTQMVTEVWHRAKQDVEREVEAVLDPMSPVADMVRSGARGSLGNLTQMAGMKGLITNPKGETIETPIISSMSEGLNPVEYFMSTHGSRKGLSDTALNTAKAGYLTRRLFDVAQDIVVSEKDCGTKQAVPLSRVSSSGVAVDFAKLVEGRYLAADATAKDGTVVAKKGTLLVPELARTVAASDVESVSVRSPRTCESGQGICQKCYGADLTTLAEIDLGEAVGTIAAQAIGEPGTQLTMRTFHAGGIAQVGGDITSGLPRVEELFDRRKPKTPAVIAKTGGTVITVVEQGAEKSITVVPNLEEANKKKDNIVYSVPAIRVPLVREGQVIKKGELLTDGSADLSELFTLAGKEVTQEYIIREVTKIYELQGASVSRKHIEVIIKQMFSRVEITAAGDTIDLTVGDMLEKADFDALVRDAKERGAEPPKADSLVLGIKEASLTRKSFLSAASFEQTNKVLINAALRGTTDTLRGLKENVIIGRLIPAGTGFPGSRKYEKIKVLQEAKAKARAQALAAREAAEAATALAAEAAA